MAPRVSVVIATYNRRDSLRATLESLFEQDPPADEIIIVIDGSNDGTSEMLRGLARESLHVIEQPNRGQAAARNAAIRVARGSFVLFLDDDLVCNPGLVRAHVEAHAGRSALVAFGSVVANDRPDLVRHFGELERRRSKQLRAVWPDDACAGAANTSVTRALLEEVGGFDEEFARAIEDIDLGFRLWDLGVPFEYVPAAQVVHRDFKTIEQQLAHAAAWGANEVLLCRKHPAYRAYSTLARRRRRPRRKAVANRIAATWPKPLAVVSRVVLRATSHAAWTPARRANAAALRLAKAALFWESAQREAGSRTALDREFGMALPALLYHHVGIPVENTYENLTVSPGRFAEQVRWLAEHGFTAIRASDWLRWCTHAAPLPAKPILLTFDDGYADLHEHAFPVLQQYGFAATVFVVTDRIGATNTWDEVNGAGTLRLLAAEQITTWAERGIEFGAHGATHEDLSQMTETELDAQLRRSRDRLQQLLGQPVVSFAYPYGRRSTTAARRVAEMFSMAFAPGEGLNHLGIPLHEMRRTEVKRTDSILDFAMRIRFGRHPLDSLRGWLRSR
jgi:GT2 family glycosyltransferase/peptidoglycan/xylan/chitin deacetylase (PgdA/CDA1 family)